MRSINPHAFYFISVLEHISSRNKKLDYRWFKMGFPQIRSVMHNIHHREFKSKGYR